jgi:ABC-type xylose transport system permease subunit
VSVTSSHGKRMASWQEAVGVTMAAVALLWGYIKALVDHSVGVFSGFTGALALLFLAVVLVVVGWVWWCTTIPAEERT